eukprot:TRINITY_DN87_c0_g1_i13.p1 TRINITY_DN87_c0_g1~~TRINITY_DN87_c0_g1_i13.p1  ORF type:complete len:799 (+),score=309.95 TRINITY_DN87_c0_g1_i13:1514-3910(+)
MKQSGQDVDEKQILDWFIQIALAMKYLHDRCILHRDLKTQNIFLTKGARIIKLGDFGIARVLGNSMEMASTMIGTPYYMSPEVFSQKPYSFKSDVWSLGCILYELATFKHAFTAKNVNGLALKVIHGEAPSLPSDYSKDLRSLCASMLNKSPSKRPSIAAILMKPFIRRHMNLFLESQKGGNPKTDQKISSSKMIQSSTSTSSSSSSVSSKKGPIRKKTGKKRVPVDTSSTSTTSSNTSSSRSSSSSSSKGQRKRTGSKSNKPRNGPLAVKRKKKKKKEDERKMGELEKQKQDLDQALLEARKQRRQKMEQDLANNKKAEEQREAEKKEKERAELEEQRRQRELESKRQKEQEALAAAQKYDRFGHSVDQSDEFGYQTPVVSNSNTKANKNDKKHTKYSLPKYPRQDNNDNSEMEVVGVRLDAEGNPEQGSAVSKLKVSESPQQKHSRVSAKVGGVSGSGNALTDSVSTSVVAKGKGRRRRTRSRTKSAGMRERDVETPVQCDEEPQIPSSVTNSHESLNVDQSNVQEEDDLDAQTKKLEEKLRSTIEEMDTLRISMEQDNTQQGEEEQSIYEEDVAQNVTGTDEFDDDFDDFGADFQVHVVNPDEMDDSFLEDSEDDEEISSFYKNADDDMHGMVGGLGYSPIEEVDTQVQLGILTPEELAMQTAVKVYQSQAKAFWHPMSEGSDNDDSEIMDAVEEDQMYNEEVDYDEEDEEQERQHQQETIESRIAVLKKQCRKQMGDEYVNLLELYEKEVNQMEFQDMVMQAIDSVRGKASVDAAIDLLQQLSFLSAYKTGLRQ